MNPRQETHDEEAGEEIKEGEIEYIEQHQEEIEVEVQVPTNCCYVWSCWSRLCIQLRCLPTSANWKDYTKESKVSKYRICRYIWIILGWVSFIVGMIGIVLPVLPTVPFLIVSAYCWARGSELCYCWFMNHPLFGDMTRNFMQHQVIPVRAKLIASILICISIPLSAVFALPERLLYAKISLGVVGLFVLIYIWHFPSKLPDDIRRDDTLPLHSE